MTILVTGAAGFVGSNLISILLAQGRRVLGVDNFCRGDRSNLGQSLANPAFTLDEVDLSNLNAYYEKVKTVHEMHPIVEVWHLAANSDIPAGIEDVGVDLRDTFMTTVNTLTVMKRLKIPRLAFASTSAVYGDLQGQRLHENIGPLFPISNYGAMKLASEALISAAIEAWLERAWIFRFPNVIGVPATHGALLDFVRKLERDPTKLEVLGNGSQQKGYLHVSELIDAMLYIQMHAPDRLAYYNIGADDDGASVKLMAEEVVAVRSPEAEIIYGEGNKGWIGDVPTFVYAVDKLRALGWRPVLGSVAAVKKAVREIVEQERKR